jgi:hypothetical protein
LCRCASGFLKEAAVVQFQGYQKTACVVGQLVLGANEQKPLTDATFEGPDALLDAAPSALRGWLLIVRAGSAELAPRLDSTLATPLPSNAFDDPDANDFSGYFAFAGAGGATIALIARIGGVS